MPMTTLTISSPRNKSTPPSIFANRFVYWMSIVAIIIFVMFPIFWISISAFKLPKDVGVPSLIFEPTLQNFEILFSDLFNLMILFLIVSLSVLQ